MASVRSGVLNKIQAQAKGLAFKNPQNVGIASTLQRGLTDVVDDLDPSGIRPDHNFRRGITVGFGNPGVGEFFPRLKIGIGERAARQEKALKPVIPPDPLEERVGCSPSTLRAWPPSFQSRPNQSRTWRNLAGQRAEVEGG